MRMYKAAGWGWALVVCGRVCGAVDGILSVVRLYLLGGLPAKMPQEFLATGRYSVVERKGDGKMEKAVREDAAGERLR